MGGIRVLLVEDDDDTSALLRDSLKGVYEVRRAVNGLEGLQLAFDWSPDLVISDINMPVLDGHEFIRRLRVYPQFEKLPVIFLSALTKPQDIKKGYELGAALYLNKPMEPGRFRRNVDLFVDDHGIVAKPHPATPPPRPAAPQATPAAPRAPQPVAAPARPVPAIVKMTETPPPQAAPRQLSPGEQAARDARRIRILLIEHDADMTQKLFNNLIDSYDPIPAHDGMEAIERAARYQPDMFLIDGGLPKTNTIHLCLMLKRNPAFKTTPILFLMEPADGQNIAQLERVGIERFLQKPVEMENIKLSIRQLVEQGGVKIGPKRIGYTQALAELSQSSQVVMTGSDTLRVAQMMRAHAEELKRG